MDTFKNKGREAFNGEYADEDGNYELIVSIDNAVVDPGDKIKIKIFITGYGKIDRAKLIFYPSKSVFEYEKSTVTTDLKEGPPGDLPVWGGVTRTLPPEGFAVSFTGGFTYGSVTKPTMFFDLNPEQGSNVLNTELLQKNLVAPVEFDLSIAKKNTPGTHFLHFGFSYFNGSEWRTSTVTVQFTVRNIFERNSGWIATIGLCAAIAALLPLFISVPLFKGKIKNSMPITTQQNSVKDTISQEYEKRIKALETEVNNLKQKHVTSSTNPMDPIKKRGKQ